MKVSPTELKLLDLFLNGREFNPPELLKEYKSKRRKTISLGSTYVMLRRLEDKGLLASRIGQPDPKRGGRPPRYYRMTGLGETTLNFYDQMAGLQKAGEGARYV